MPDLKPCPFCGGKPFMGNDGDYHIVRCLEGCGAEIADEVRRKAREAWNRRAITPAEAARVLRERWSEGAFENDADAAVQDLLDFGITDGHDIIENWLKAIAGDDTAPEDAT